jgi:hypothetical protein
MRLTTRFLLSKLQMFLSNFLRWLRTVGNQLVVLLKLFMWKTFYIKPNEIGILYHRSDFKKILHPGTYTHFGRHWQVKTYDLNQPEAQIENLELLLRYHEVDSTKWL